MDRMAKNRCRIRSGFTLMELLVVGFLGVLVLTIIGNAWQWYARSWRSIEVSAILTRELKLATEGISQDYGPAIASRALDSATLQIDIDGGSLDGIADWASPDTVIEYDVQNGQLIRHDLLAGTDVPLARHITSMSTEVVDGYLQVHLVAHLRDTDLAITLQLQGS